MTATRPREAQKAARLYRSREALRDADIWRQNAERKGSAALVFSTVYRRLGADCSRYLCDATYRWLLSSIRCPSGLPSYTQRWLAFCLGTDSWTLHRVLATTDKDIEAWLYSLEARRLAPRTINAHLQIARSFFAWAEDRGLVATSPIRRRFARRWRVDAKRIRKADGSRQALTFTEAQRVVTWALTEAQPVAGLSVLLQAVAGLRSAEVAALRMVDLTCTELDGDNVWAVNVSGKGNRSRKVPLEPVVISAWHRYQKAYRRTGTRGALLRPAGGGSYSAASVQRWAKLAAGIVGRTEQISSHDLRATAATLLVEAGAALDEVQDLLGHSGIETTKRLYVRRGRRLTAATGLEAPKEKGTA